VPGFDPARLGGYTRVTNRKLSLGVWETMCFRHSRFEGPGGLTWQYLLIRA
jgi:hypothetical protein